MVTSSGRLIHRQAFLQVFAACVFLIYSWSVVHLLREVPAWLVYLSTWDLLGVIAYTQAFALFESLLAVTALVALAMILPARLLRQEFATRGTVLIVVTSLVAMLAHYRDYLVPASQVQGFVLLGILYVASLALSILLLRRSERFRVGVLRFSDRLTIFLYLYLPISAVSLGIIVVRNL